MSEIDLDEVEMLVAIEPNGMARCLVCDETEVNASMLRDHDCDEAAATGKIPVAARNLVMNLGGDDVYEDFHQSRVAAVEAIQELAEFFGGIR